MNRSKGQNRNFNRNGQTRTVGVTTEQLRNRKAAREEVGKRPRDLRSNLVNKSGLKSQDRTSKFLDARQKILSKRSVEQLPEKTSLSINDRRKALRSEIISKNRSLSLDSGSIKITAKQNLPPNRSAQFAGKSIQITAKLPTNAKPTNTKAKVNQKERNAQMFGSGHIAITAKSPKGMKSATPRNRKQQQSLRSRKKEPARETYENVEHIIASRPRQPTPLSERLDYGPEPPRFTNTPQTSTRVTITNLFPNVTRQDIEELFGAVGVLKSCKTLRPGAAEVVYTCKEDAVTAFARYHNRNLDGQPMQCKLSVMPSAAIYTTPAAQAAPLPPLRPAAPAIPKYKPEVYVPQIHVAPRRPSSTPSRPVVFKVKI